MINAYDLGEDGNRWMVEGTLDPDEARKAVRALWGEQGVTADNAEFGPLTCEPREDWWWEPLSAEMPDDEAWLRHKNRPEGVEPFAGVLVMA